MCDSCNKVLRENGVKVIYYSIGMDFKPQISFWDGWLYVVNFYGQLSNEFLASLGKNVIIDNAQAYFQKPITGIDTLYTCRKFFGVADGAVLYTNKYIEVATREESYSRMRFLMGRYERNAEEFYQEYVDNNCFFQNEPIKVMSKLTENLLHGIDYRLVKKRRTENYLYLQATLKELNKLKLVIPQGAFMYPLYIENGNEIRKKLQAKKIFIPTLWPAVFQLCKEDELEYDMARNILPIPVDQRYGIGDMKLIVNELREILE